MEEVNEKKNVKTLYGHCIKKLNGRALLNQHSYVAINAHFFIEKAKPILYNYN